MNWIFWNVLRHMACNFPFGELRLQWSEALYVFHFIDKEKSQNTNNNHINKCFNKYTKFDGLPLSRFKLEF